jgi:transcriptional regulator with XRE-family HTH domain
MSQQALADASGITQNGVIRIESGGTNPQLTSLQQIALALKCTVRDLMIGASEPILAERFRRVKRVIESEDPAALRAMDNGIETAEALLERAGGPIGLPPLRVKDEGRRSPADDLLWLQGSRKR